MWGLLYSPGSLWRIAGGIGANDPSIQISSTTIAEDASVGDPLGTLSVQNGSGSYTYAIVGGTLAALFAIDGDAVEVNDTLSATTGTLEIEADNGVDPVVSRTFDITITAVGSGSAGEPFGMLLTLTKAA